MPSTDSPLASLARATDPARAVLRYALALAALLSILAAVAAPSADARSRARDFVGLTAEDVFAGDANYREVNLTAQAAIGVGLLRQTFDWSRIETAPGQFDLSYHDAYVLQAASKGIEILPILFNPPEFRAPRAERGTHPPTNLADMAAFAEVLVRRYGPQGTLWAETPGVPALPIRSYQLWNEVNLKVYWLPRPDPRAYVRMLEVVGGAIKRLDPGAEIVTAGMPESRLSKPLPLLSYLRAMYRAGGARHFDTLAINTYARDERDLLKLLRSVRAEMNRGRDRRTPIWATEIGWSDVGPRSPFRAGRRGQAKRITRALKVIGKQRRALRLRGVVYYSWKDAPPYPPAFRDFWGLHTGLLNINGEPKPAYHAFKQAVSRLR